MNFRYRRFLDCMAKKTVPTRNSINFTHKKAGQGINSFPRTSARTTLPTKMQVQAAELEEGR